MRREANQSALGITAPEPDGEERTVRTGSSDGDRRPPKLSAHIAQRIVTDIVDGGLQPGDRLPAAAVMSERYQVGIASLREGLRLLEMSGLVYLKSGPGGGPIVSDRSGTELGYTIRLYFQTMGVTFRDVVQARRTLEPLLAREAASRASPELRAALTRSVSDARSATEADQFPRHARGFHDLLATQMPSNPILGLFVATVGDVYAEFVRTRGPHDIRDDRPEVLGEHAEIAEAIEAGDVDRAEALMDAHMAGLVEYVSMQYEMTLDDVVSWG